MNDPWTVLGLEPGASPAAVEAAYRYRAKLAHPDLGGDAASFAALAQARREARQQAFDWPCMHCGGTGRLTFQRGQQTASIYCATCGGSGKKWGL